MKIEMLVFAVTAFFIADKYHDGKYTLIIQSWKKYYQMAGIAFAGLSAYLFFKKNPSNTRSFLSSASGIIRRMPVDSSTSNIFESFIQMAKQSDSADSVQAQKVQQSGGGSKRCVSETKKKYVAAQQGWVCGSCKKQLPAWFEIDHTIRLDNGGTNHIDNLVALCRDCHGEKTACENL